MFDLVSNINVINGLEPAAVGTTGTGRTSLAVDLQKYNSVAIACEYGAVTATNAVFTATLFEGATTGGAFTSVADADLIRTEALAGLAAATRADGTTEKVVKTFGYKGGSRYIKIKIASTVTAGAIVSAAVIRGNAKDQPSVT